MNNAGCNLALNTISMQFISFSLHSECKIRCNAIIAANIFFTNLFLWIELIWILKLLHLFRTHFLSLMFWTMENIAVIISGRGIGDKQLLNQSEIPTHTDVIYTVCTYTAIYIIHIQYTYCQIHSNMINLYSLGCVCFDTKPCKTMLRLNGGAFSKTHRAQNFFRNPPS